jgi:DNA ligase (NAD+)
LAKEFPSLSELLALPNEPWRLTNLDGIGEVMAAEILGWLGSKSNAGLLAELSSQVPVKMPEPVAAGGNRLADHTFVITGTLSMPRDYFKTMIEDNGGKVSGAMSKKTDYLLAGEKAGSKLAKAESLGVPVIDEVTFVGMLKM